MNDGMYEPNQNGSDVPGMALLTRWVEGSVRRVGRTRLENLICLYEEMGGISAFTRSTLFQIIDTAAVEPEPRHISLQECQVVLLELETLLRRTQPGKAGATMLYAMLRDRR